ncbi:PREDICTED: DNA topoisomerase 2-binding protein 1-A isoform X2 [Tarenaya hassleriana]|uniref:DNA topoisomerase 2-binding protein 1-A isoform X2 n=1 Tax=Tarenaya hassleriana TaxID=28532 RepID=UPI00053C9954|nr:PREDICTED: DNA topoisomerase 2-binding protein 1-A isoform X2 [Tarenaya hassleriana]
MKTTQLFKGSNVFMSRNLVPPEVFDALLDALKLNGADIFLCCDPSRNGPDDFHVIASPNHEKFEDLRVKGCNLIGPQCVLSCAKENRPLPKGGFTCCLAMDGLKVLASGFQMDEKVKIGKLVTAMGGVLLGKASSDVNFVVVKNVLAAKYKWALNIQKKPVVTLNWLHQCWNEHRVVPQEPYKVLPFSGLTICVTRIPADERKEIEKLISQNGGKYSAELTKNCTHLIADIAEGDKYRVARKWGHIHIVTRKWFDQSIARKVCLSEESYPVNNGFASSTKRTRALASQNGQEKVLGNAVPVSSAAAESDVPAGSQSRESDLEASVSQNVCSSSMNPTAFVKGDSADPTTEPQENNVDGCVAEDSESEDNDLYLSECRIFFIGFGASEMRRLVNMVRRGGGSRYIQLHDKLTHIVVGTPSEGEKRQARRVAASGIIQVVTTGWLEDCDRGRKEIPVHKKYTAHNLILPRGIPDMDESKTSLRRTMPYDTSARSISDSTGAAMLFGKNVEDRVEFGRKEEIHVEDRVELGRKEQGHVEDRVEFGRKEEIDVEDRVELGRREQSHVEDRVEFGRKEEIHVEVRVESSRKEEIHVEGRVESGRKEKIHVEANMGSPKQKESFPSLENRKSMEQRTHRDSNDQNKQGTTLFVFRGKSFCFSHSFPEDRRAEIVEWVNVGGGEVVNDPFKHTVDFTVECHGVIPRTAWTTQTTYVSSHWVRSCLEVGCLLDVGSHILYSPLPCQTPLSGFQSFRICVSQYEEKDRLLLRNLCFVLGAKFVEKLTRKVTHLLCKFADGPKYEAACKWGIVSVTSDWVYECVRQNQVVGSDNFHPKQMTTQDREAGCCLASQFPTQFVPMTSRANGSLFVSKSEERKDANGCIEGELNNRHGDIGRQLNKKARLSKDGQEGHVLPMGEHPSNNGYALNSGEDNESVNDVESGRVVPDVAAAIEDLLEQTSKIQDQNSPVRISDKTLFPSNSLAVEQSNTGIHAVTGLSRHWLNRVPKHDEVLSPSGGVTSGTYGNFSETQTESQVVGYEEDLSGRQMLIDRVRTRSSLA